MARLKKGDAEDHNLLDGGDLETGEKRRPDNAR
jgi:hypothetical protein